MTQNDSLKDICANQIDQILAFVHLLAKIISCKGKNGVLRVQEIKTILQSKIEIDSYFKFESRGSIGKLLNNAMC